MQYVTSKSLSVRKIQLMHTQIRRRGEPINHLKNMVHSASSKFYETEDTNCLRACFFFTYQSLLCLISFSQACLLQTSLSSLPRSCGIPTPVVWSGISLCAKSQQTCQLVLFFFFFFYVLWESPGLVRPPAINDLPASYARWYYILLRVRNSWIRGIGNSMGGARSRRLLR